MKQFLKFTLASMTGLLIAFLLFFFILIGIAGSVSSSSKSVTVDDNSILKINLDGTFREQSMENPFNFEIPGLPVNTHVQEQGLDDILSALEKAAKDDKIKGVYIETGVMNTGYATSEEIRNALIKFRKSGKFIYAYGEVLDQKEYYISTVADSLFFNPQGMLNWHGLAATPIFYKGTLDKIGIKPEIFRVGTFKSAVEPFIGTKMSDANKLQMTEALGSLWGHLVKGVSDSRKITPEELNKLANKNTLFEEATELVRARMVDKLLYKPEMMDLLSKKAGVEDVDKLKLVNVADYLLAPGTATDFEKEKVAVLYADGEISDSGSEGIVTDDMLSEIHKIEKDAQIKAVVLRVNSPGGSAYASEQIWKALADLKKKKPLVVSMGDYAASGGYYISSCADKIVAQPNTITGSIGIFGMFFITDEIARKVGLSFDVVKTNDLSDLGNMTRPFTDIEKLKIQRHINRGYDLFVKRCADGRKMKDESIRKIAEGRIWTGVKAKELGLVDEIGSLGKAIGIAAKLGKTAKYRTVYFPEKKNVLEVFMQEMTGNTRAKIAAAVLGDEYAPLLKLKTSRIQSGVLARSPEIDFK